MRTTLVVVLTFVVVASMAATPAAAGAAPSAPTGSAPADAASVDAPAAGDRAATGTAESTAAADVRADNHSDACAPLNGGEGREDPEEDQLGWENGCWYDEPLDVDRSDGLNDTELAAVVGRSMARVERVRELEFEKTVPVEVISREEFGERISSRYENVSDEERLFHNVLAEARFFAGEGDDWVGTLEELKVGGTGGFYSPSDERIVVISDNTTSPKMNEITLAQELYHALQDQKFDLVSDGYGDDFAAGEMNVDDHNRYDGVIEGDGNFVDYLYGQRCQEEWNCLMPEESAAGGGARYTGGELGAIATQLVPYSEGVGFVQAVYQEGGWEAVNQLYEDPPASTEQYIHPDEYGEDAPTELTVADADSDRWRRLVPPDDGQLGGIPAQNASHATFGEGGMFAMFFAPSYESRSSEIVKFDGFFTDSEVEPYDYRSPVTEGWDGDRLVVFVTDESVETDETAYVWKTEWDSEEDAQQFASAYVALLDYRGADPVDGRADTYRISENGRFDDAFYLNHTGTTVTIVNAPTVEELREIRADAAPEATPTPSPTATETEASDDATPTSTGEPVDEPASPTDTTSPGFGPAVALLALAAAALLARRR